MYKQLAAELARQIGAGQYACGQCIPSEPALAALYGLGRPTVRQATDLLVRRGLVERRRGAGTFVRPSDAQVNLFDWAGTTQAFQESGLAFRATLLQRPKLHAIDDPDHPLDGKTVYSLVRLGCVQGEPIVLEKMSLDAEVFPNLHQHSLKGQSISKLVQQEYRRQPSLVRQSFAVGRIEERWCASMRVDGRRQVLIVSRVLDFPGAAAAVASVMYCRTDMMKFTQNLPVPAV